jgi:predicted HTH domain antitoxin
MEKESAMSEVICDLPPEVLAALRELGEPAPMVKECVVLELYRRGLLSSGKAAELLGMNREAFIHYTGRLGIPFFRMTADEWEEEARQARELDTW